MQFISPNYNWENGVQQIQIIEENLSQSCILCWFLKLTASLDILCCNPLNLKNKITKIQHKKIFCGPSKKVACLMFRKRGFKLSLINSFTILLKASKMQYNADFSLYFKIILYLIYQKWQKYLKQKFHIQYNQTAII